MTPSYTAQASTMDRVHPYRSREEEQAADAPSLLLLVAAVVVTWALLVHGLGRLSGRW